MPNFSLIESVENIYFERTKEYFQEIKSSYESGNYRSAIVSLYSVVISDIVYKLIELRDVFADEKAKSILEEIEQKQKQNPKSSEWESKLVDVVTERISLISPSLFTNIKNLQNIRHLSAHPVLTQNYNLYKPNKETVIALIRVTTEELFTNPPLLSKGIFTKLILDIAKHQDSLWEYDAIKNFLESRYLNYTTPEIKKYIFKNLWKLVFKLETEECNKNRRVNVRALRVLYDQNPDLFLKEIKREKKYYSQISEEQPLKGFLFFVGLNPQIYNILEDDAKILIETSVKGSKSNKLSAWFLANDLKSHLEWMKENEKQITLIAPNEFAPIYQSCVENGIVSEFYEVVIHYYTQIKGKQDDYYVRLNILRKHMKDFNEKSFHLLLSKINSSKHLSNKIYGLINQDLIDRIREILQNENFGTEEDYPLFFKCLKDNEEIII